MNDIQAILDEIGDDFRHLSERGRLADYIPQLAKADLSKFGLCVVTTDGLVCSVGDADETFTIQSVSKIFT